MIQVYPQYVTIHSIPPASVNRLEQTPAKGSIRNWLATNLRGHRWMRYLAALSLVGLATLIDYPFHTRIAPANLSIIYLAAVVISAAYLGRGPAILSSVLGVLVFDFFFVPPYLTLAISQLEYLITFAGLLLVGLIISELTVRVREEGEARLRLAENANQLKVIQETERLQSALINSISHDLRTPLVSITGSLSTLKEADLVALDQEMRNNLVDNAYQEAVRLNRLVGNLLNMTRLEAGAMKISKQPEDITDAIGAALEQLRERVGQRTVNIQAKPDLPLVSMDIVLIVQVLVNVIDNGLKYSPDNSSIDIQAQIARNKLEVAISDRGAGIPPEDLENVFNKFYRVHRPDNVQGTGLGLSICKAIIEAHGGTIRATNRSGGGTTIRLELPLTPAEAR